MRGDASISQRTIQSDTLYSALISCLAKAGVSIPAQGELECTISSLFPFYQKDEESAPCYFLPMPYQSHLPELQDVSLAKKVKKVQWVDSSLYGEILNSIHKIEWEKEYIKSIYGSFLLNPEKYIHKELDGGEEKLLFENFIVSSVAVRGAKPDRSGIEPAVPFYTDRIFFKGKSGMYFIVDGNTSYIDKALNILKDEGLGTDRHVGYGSFEFEKSEMSIDCPTQEDTNYWMSLSILIPQDEKQLKGLLEKDSVAYELIRRGGWITTHPYTTYRKNVIYAFKPGSVLGKTCDANVIGRIVDLTPDKDVITIDHKIWRNGRAIMLPINL